MMPIFRLDEVDSTLSEARRWVHAGRPPGFALTARRQTAGRGRMQRQWTLQEGNLALTIVVPRDALVPAVATLPLIQGLAIHAAVSDIIGSAAQVCLKWPNDLYLNGAKASGTLVEAAGGALYIGTGVNVAHSPSGIETDAAHLEQFVERKVDVDQLAEAIVLNWESLFAQWSVIGFGPFVSRYNGLLFQLNGSAFISLDREKLTGHRGINRGVNADGPLLLEQDGVITAHFAGDMVIAG